MIHDRQPEWICCTLPPARELERMSDLPSAAIASARRTVPWDHTASRGFGAVEPP